MRRIVRTFLRNKDWNYLLVKHKWKNYWSLPGWWIEEKESIYKAIKRECLEELNLKIKILWEKIWLKIDYIEEKPKPICIYKIKYNEFNWKEVKRIEYIFLSEIKSWDLKIQEDEIEEIRFFSKKEILKLENTHIQVKEILKKI